MAAGAAPSRNALTGRRQRAELASRMKRGGENGLQYPPALRRVRRTRRLQSVDRRVRSTGGRARRWRGAAARRGHRHPPDAVYRRSEEHTSELQSRGHLVCRLLLEKKKT